jgi:hypothetical protein
MTLWITLWTTRRSPAQNPVDNSASLTRLLPSSYESKPVRRCSLLSSSVVVGVLCLFLGLSSITTTHANAIDHYKLYAHSRLINYEEYKCLSHIIYKESRWNINAVNGSHYGLGQMRSKWYRNLDGYRQIDATIKYAKKRYGSMCNAWSFHQQRNYY